MKAHKAGKKAVVTQSALMKRRAGEGKCIRCGGEKIGSVAVLEGVKIVSTDRLCAKCHAGTFR